MSVESGQIQEKKSFINLAVVENRKGEVLLVRRVKKETGTGGAVLEWSFPGGKQRIGEVREQSLARDVIGETGYEVKSIKQLHIRMHPQFPVMVVYHQCKLAKEEQAAEPIEPEEIAEIKWVPAAEVPDYITVNIDPVVQQTLRIKVDK